MSNAKRIIMHYSYPPSFDDLEVMADSILQDLPEELDEAIESIAINVEDVPDEVIEEELDLDDPFDLLALYRNGKEISPGIEKKSANDDGLLILYRRPILDLWCETSDDLADVLRHVIIEELGKHFDFSDDEIEEMSRRHY